MRSAPLIESRIDLTEEQDRTDPSSLLPMPKTVATKPYDWTYTTTYPGHDLENESPGIRWRVADPEDASHAIPIAELTRQDPILFYAEVPLYEDELHDNGSSALLVRIVCFISFTHNLTYG